MWDDIFGNEKKTFLWLVFWVVPFFDLLTGLLLHLNIISVAGIASPSQLIRLLALVVGITYFERRELLFLFTILLYLLGVESISYALLHQSQYGISYGLINANKIVYLLVIAVAVRYFLEKRFVDLNELIKFILSFCSIYALNVIICLIFGLGDKTYGVNTFGTKGFVASNNGLSIVLGAGSLLSLYYWKTCKGSIAYFLILLPGCLFVGAKTSLIMFLMSLLLLFRLSSTKWKLLVVGGVIPVLVIVWSKISAAAAIVFDVIKFRLELAQKGGDWASFIFSGRNQYVINAFNEFLDGSDTIWRFFIGAGAFGSFRSQHKLLIDAYHEYFTLETDFFDLFFQYGITGCVLYLMLIFSVTVYFVKQREYHLLLIWMLFAFFSVFDGHVFFDGMTATLFATLVAMGWYSNHKPKLD